MKETPSVDLRRYLTEWRADIDELRQNRLLGEGSFITFARERGLTVHGAITGDPSDFNKRGWLAADETDEDGTPRFHPFRLYPLHRLVNRRTAFGALDPQFVVDGRTMDEATVEWNTIADLAILLEPLYWPEIVGRASVRTQSAEAHRRLLEGYRKKMLGLLKALDSKEWREIHEALRIDAGWMDKNEKLYVFLRLSKWEEREKLTGVVSGALWLRHIGEVIRRGFEEAFGEEWPEEYHAFALWHEAACKRAFGSERPLNDPLRSKSYIAWTFGLFTGSSVRWYVEGDTEYYAALEILEEPSIVGVELVNMRGNFSERDNAALKFQDWLKEDQALRRFSMVSFDRDVSANVKVITRQVRQNNIVGMIAVHEPDFEFANFAIEELIEIAAGLDEAQGFSAELVRKADWTGVKKGKAFEQHYARFSQKAQVLKGETWGRALATYAAEHARRSDNHAERPFWRQIRAALHGWMSNYDEQQQRFEFDPQTFEIIASTRPFKTPTQTT